MQERLKFNITREQFVEYARIAANFDTCLTDYTPKWNYLDPLADHCAIATCAAQDIFGGDLYRFSLEGHEGFRKGDSHYKLIHPLDNPDKPFDPTFEQFHGHYPWGLEKTAVIRERSYTLNPIRYPDSVRRYKLFSLRLANVRVEGNPLFLDTRYQECFFQALDSPCKKMRFGCKAMRDGEFVAGEANFTLLEPEKRNECKDWCVRLNIRSRTKQQLGACGHAERWTWKSLLREEIDPHDCELFVVGIYGLGNGLPYIKEKAQFSCPQCAKQITEAGFKAVNMPVVNRWVRVPTCEIMDQANEYIKELGS